MVNTRTTRPERLSKWIETNVGLPEGGAKPEPFKLYPYQRAIADAIAKPKVERVRVLKAARLGFTSVLTAALANFVVRDPARCRPNAAGWRPLHVAPITTMSGWDAAGRAPPNSPREPEL